MIQIRDRRSDGGQRRVVVVRHLCGHRASAPVCVKGHRESTEPNGVEGRAASESYGLLIDIVNRFAVRSCISSRPAAEGSTGEGAPLCIQGLWNARFEFLHIRGRSAGVAVECHVEGGWCGNRAQWQRKQEHDGGESHSEGLHQTLRLTPERGAQASDMTITHRGIIPDG